MDEELAKAPTQWAFLAAFVTKYGLLGLVIVWLIFTQWKQNEQSLHAQEARNAEMAKLYEQSNQRADRQTEAMVRGNEIQLRMVQFLERQERGPR